MKFTIGRPKPRFAKPLPVIVKLAGGVARSIELGVMPLTPGTGRVSVTVSAALPIRLKGTALPVCCQIWAWTGPAVNPSRFGVIAVAGVGQGTVSVVLPVSAVARACASSAVPRMKFTFFFNDTASTEIYPLSLHDALPISRSIELGVMPLTPGTGRVSVTVSAALPIRLKVGALPVCCQTWAWTGPADSPGRFGVIDVAGVGKGTVSVVPPVRAVARACASSVVPRMKFTIGRPKPRFAKPLPVIVKLAGGVARSIELGVMPLTPTAVPVTASETSPPLEVKLTFAAKTPGAVGLNRTTTAWLTPWTRLKEPPETMLKGGVVEALPVRIPPPVFWTTKVLSTEFPTFTVPKSCEPGVTERTGGPGVSPSRSALSARSTWIRGRVVPVPARGSVIIVPVPVRASRIESTLAAGAACLSTAHVPATCGDAIDVPLANSNPPPGNDEMISSPGANRDRKGATFE